jgi:hypothetical protein
LGVYMLKAMSDVEDLLGKVDKEKPKKEVKEVRVRKGKSGGHIMEHHHTRPEHHPVEEHVTSTNKDMMAHMMENMGQEEPESNAEAQSEVQPEAQPAQ